MVAKLVAPFMVESDQCLTCVEIERAVERGRLQSNEGRQPGMRYAVRRYDGPDEVTDDV